MIEREQDSGASVPRADTGESEALRGELAALQKALEEQRSKAEGYLANWQKAEAALANYRRRAEQEKQELESFANAVLVSSLLPVLDDLERALDNLDADLAGLTWIDGLKLIYRKLQALLEAQGLSAISTVGAAFDPKLHEAIIQVDGEEGKVMGELQKGYRFRDRVIRPAMVKVGRAKPDQGAEQPLQPPPARD